MKTTITVSVDAELKEKAMWIIQNKRNESISHLVNEMLKEVVENSDKLEVAA